jgi:hypothetical protein
MRSMQSQVPGQGPGVLSYVLIRPNASYIFTQR